MPDKMANEIIDDIIAENPLKDFLAVRPQELSDDEIRQLITRLRADRAAFNQPAPPKPEEVT